jgi:hypothetical protein
MNLVGCISWNGVDKSHVQDQDEIVGTDCPFASGMFAEVMLWVSQQQAHCRAMWAESDVEEDDGNVPNLAASSTAYFVFCFAAFCWAW